jgi:hypothetical protein
MPVKEMKDDDDEIETRPEFTFLNGAKYLG